MSALTLVRAGRTGPARRPRPPCVARAPRRARPRSARPRPRPARAARRPRRAARPARPPRPPGPPPPPPRPPRAAPPAGGSIIRGAGTALPRQCGTGRAHGQQLRGAHQSHVPLVRGEGPRAVPRREPSGQPSRRVDRRGGDRAARPGQTAPGAQGQGRAATLRRCRHAERRPSASSARDAWWAPLAGACTHTAAEATLPAPPPGNTPATGRGQRPLAGAVVRSFQSLRGQPRDGAARAGG